MQGKDPATGAGRAFHCCCILYLWWGKGSSSCQSLSLLPGSFPMEGKCSRSGELAKPAPFPLFPLTRIFPCHRERLHNGELPKCPHCLLPARAFPHRQNLFLQTGKAPETGRQWDTPLLKIAGRWVAGLGE